MKKSSSKELVGYWSLISERGGGYKKGGVWGKCSHTEGVGGTESFEVV